MIKAPFNFVPLFKKVYFPSWADKISQDVPFSDGLSGQLTYTITAETPIFIRDGHAGNDEDRTVVQEFCHTDDNRYYIPGTTVKGALRNVLEILSLGKMSQVQNRSFGLRDLNGGDKEFYRTKVNTSNVRCGWLRVEGDNYCLEDCGTPWRISAERIDEEYSGLHLVDFIRNAHDLKEDANRTAKRKYLLFRDNCPGESLDGHFVFDAETEKKINAGGRTLRRFSEDGDGEAGTLVFTGQPGVRKQVEVEEDGETKMKWTGKFFEFAFPARVQNTITVPAHVVRAFLSIHADSPDYKDFRREQLMDGKKIPVFFILDDNGELDAIGLSYMFKYPSFSSIYNGIPLEMLSPERHDLCECLFGYTGKEDSLKGRVQMTAAVLQGEPLFYVGEEGVKIVLSKPHPSYYPTYLGKGQTWNSKKVEIAGRKRFPVRDKSEIFDNEGSPDMERHIRPLDSGSVFCGKVLFHNLRPVELGALLSCMDFCEHEDCCHNLGQGKPLGYGRVKIKVTDVTVKRIVSDTAYAPSDVRAIFCDEMEATMEGWADSIQLRELYAMARGIPAGKGTQFQYMVMTTTGTNEFNAARQEYAKKGKQLGLFTQILSSTVPDAVLDRNYDTSTKRIDYEKVMEDIEYLRQLDPKALEGKEGLVIIADAMTRMEQMPKEQVTEDIKAIRDSLAAREKAIAKIIIKEEKEKAQNTIESTAAPSTTPVEKGFLGTLTYAKKQGSSVCLRVLMEEGKDKGKKVEVTVAININTKNIKWDKVKKVRVEFDRGRNKYTYYKIVK